MESCWWFLRAIVAKWPVAVEWCHRAAASTPGQLPAPLQQLGMGRWLVRGWKLWGRTHRERGELLNIFSPFPPFLIFCLFNIHIHVCRDGATQLTSLLRTTKTRGGTLASVAGDGSATRGIKPWIPGLRCVLSSLSVYILCAFVCVSKVLRLFTYVSLPLYPDRSRHSTYLSQIHSVTSAVEAGRSARSPEDGCHCGQCPYRAGYIHLHTHLNVLYRQPVHHTTYI